MMASGDDMNFQGVRTPFSPLDPRMGLLLCVMPLLILDCVFQMLSMLYHAATIALFGILLNQWL